METVLDWQGEKLYSNLGNSNSITGWYISHFIIKVKEQVLKITVATMIC